MEHPERRRIVVVRMSLKVVPFTYGEANYRRFPFRRRYPLFPAMMQP